MRGRTPLYEIGSLSVAGFHRYLRLGIPIILTGLHGFFQEHWDPSYFRDAFGDDEQAAVECESNKFVGVAVTMREFLDTFTTQPRERRRILKVKVSHIRFPVPACSNLSGLAAHSDNGREVHKSCRRLEPIRPLQPSHST